MEEKPYKKCTETRIKLEIEKQIEYTKRNPYWKCVEARVEL